MPKKVSGTLALIGLACLCGCATAPETKDEKLLWPLPPEEPRIAYVRSLLGEADFVKRSFFDFLLGSPSMGGLGKPYGVFARGDKVYASLTARGMVAVINAKERTVTYRGDRGAGKLSLPMGVAEAANGTLFVSDARLNRVFGYNAEGDLTVAIGKKDELLSPSGIAVNDELGRLYVVDTPGHNVHVYSLPGVSLFTFGVRGSGDGQFNYPTNVALDRRTGNVYVVDTQNFRVQVFDKDGKFLKKFGQIGDRLGDFARPKGIGIDSEGHVYVADAAFDNFQIFNEEGQLLLYVGRAGLEPGTFQLPAGLYVDDKDRIYVADQLNGRVQVFQYLSEKWKKENPEELKKYQAQQ